MRRGLLVHREREPATEVTARDPGLQGHAHAAGKTVNRELRLRKKNT